MMNATPVIQVVGYKNSGKTSITCDLIKRFSGAGVKVGSIKHDAHDFEMDHPGKDTWKHREAGAVAVAISSKDKTAFIEQYGTSLDDLVARMSHLDLIVVEGYKFSSYPKIVLLRNENDLSLLDETTNVMAVGSWIPYTHPTIPVVSIEDKDKLFEISSKFLCARYRGDKYEKFCNCEGKN
jgi:molybdopterin-guanine dinucleotide biosynthesis adapter protein